MASNSLHDLALEAQTNIHELATGLAHAGADPQAVQKLSQFAEVLGEIAKAVHENPGVEQAAATGSPGPASPPAGAGPNPPAPAPQAPAPAPSGAGGPFHGPTTQLHQAMQASAAQHGGAL